MRVGGLENDGSEGCEGTRGEGGRDLANVRYVHLVSMYAV